MQDNLLHVRVTPRASRNRIELDATGKIKVYVTAPPEDGKANQAVCELVAKTLGVPKTNVWVVTGHKSREKGLRIEGLSSQKVVENLEGKLRNKKLPGM